MYLEKKNTGWWLNLCKSIYTNRAAPRRSNSKIWHEDSGTWARLHFLGHSAQRTVVICTYICLKLQGTELLSSNFGHCVTPLMPDQIKRIECRNSASCDLREPGWAAQPLPGTAPLHNQGDSASFLLLLFLPHPFPQPLLFFKNVGHLAYTGTALPSEDCFCAVPQDRNKVGIDATGSKAAILAEELSSLLLGVSMWGIYRQVFILFFFVIVQIKVQNITNTQPAEMHCFP